MWKSRPFIALLALAPLAAVFLMSAPLARGANEPAPPPVAAPLKRPDPPQTVPQLEALLATLREAGNADDSSVSPGRGLGAMMEVVIALRDPMFVPVLGRHLVGDPSWKVRTACVVALTQIKTPDSTSALLEFLRGIQIVSPADSEALKTVGVRTQADLWLRAEAVTQAAAALVDRGKYAAAKGDLIRLCLFDAMAKAGRPGAETLMDLATRYGEGTLKFPEGVSEDTLLKRAFAQIRDPECLDLLRATAAGEKVPTFCREGALAALADGWPEKEYPTILRVAREATDPSVKQCAYCLAVKLRPAAARDELLPLLKHLNPALRECGTLLLGSLQDAKSKPYLIELLDDEDDRVRLAALEALWPAERIRRTVRWADPRFETRYQDFLRSHAEPKSGERK